MSEACGITPQALTIPELTSTHGANLCGSVLIQAWKGNTNVLRADAMLCLHRRCLCSCTESCHDQTPWFQQKEPFRIMSDAIVQLLMTKLTDIKQICQKELLGYRHLKNPELQKQR